MTNQLVSIIINNYNYGRFLSEAIESSLNQTYRNIEVIVVDDGSTDNSIEVIESFQDRIIPLFKDNGGQASAFNLGFSKCQGEIICLLDADDVFLPEKVSKIVNVFSTNEQIGWCFHPLAFSKATEEGFELIANYPPPPNKVSSQIDFISSITKGKFPAFGSATSGQCYRNSLLKEILPMPEEIRICSDNYVRYVALLKSKGYFINKSLAILRIHESNNYTLQKNKLDQDSKYRMLTAYWLKNNYTNIGSDRFSNKLLGMALGTQKYVNCDLFEYKNILQSYMSQVSTLEKIEIKFRTQYHYFKNLIKNN